MAGYETVIAMLRRRGFAVERCNPKEYLLFPPGWETAFEHELYEILKKYSFRIFIRDVIRLRKSFEVKDLMKYSTREWVEEYVRFLLERGVVEVHPARKGEEAAYRLKAESVFSFGDTLEWFVANAFHREFSSPAVWGARLKGVSAGGDYDVIAAVEGRLVYVEVKSSPPKNVEEVEVAAFLKRVEALAPSAAIFLEDTRLRMTDKIVPFFEGRLRKKKLRVKRLEKETFSIGEKVYVTNSAPDLVGNLALCLRDFLQPRKFW